MEFMIYIAYIEAFAAFSTIDDLRRFVRFQARTVDFPIVTKTGFSTNTNRYIISLTAGFMQMSWDQVQAYYDWKDGVMA